MTVLYVDDEALARKYFARALGDEFRILTAASAAEALQLLSAPDAAVDVLVTDQRMPNQAGVELLRECRRRWPQIVRLLLTAHASVEDAVRAVNEGEVYRFLTKPWDEETLRAELRAALALHAARRRERELLEARRQTLTALAASVAHEMRTPLAGVAAAAGVIAHYLPALLAAHERAAAAGLDVEPIRPAHRRALNESLSRIGRTVQQAQLMIDLLLMNARDDWAVGAWRLYSMRECVQQALASYPFPEGARDRVSARLDNDFYFRGSDVLMLYVLYNLLRNALYALEAAGRGRIELSLAPSAGGNTLSFVDTGTGIPADMQPRLFEDFYSGRRTGAGMGLSFCRRVLESFGGHIACRSEPDRYTEFILWLPHPETALR